MEAIVDEYIGRAHVVVTQGEGEGATAVITQVYARALESSSDLVVSGPGEFAEPVLDHVRSLVLPVVQRVLELLEVRPTGYELSVGNVGAAAVQDVGLSMSGFSADLSLFLALLSASLRLPLPNDVVCTGHIASLDGTVRFVRSLAAKLNAVCASAYVRRFVYPADDGSLAQWSPAEWERAREALRKVRGRVATVSVVDLADVLREVSTARSRVLASLESGYFGRGFPDARDGVARAAEVLAGASDEQFWQVLEEDLFEENIANARELLETRLNWHVKRSEYPEGIGDRLSGLVCSLPPTGTVLDPDDALVSIDVVQAVCAFADDLDDAALLTAAVQGPLPRRTEGPAGDDVLAKRLERALLRVSEDTLTQEVALAYDAARASYRLSSITVKTHEELDDVLAAFYLHLQGKIGAVRGHVERETLGRDALALLETAFARSGGYRAALSEARSGTKGGLRLILDVMTEEAKRKARQDQVNWILKEALDALDYEQKVRFIGLFIERLRDHLPEGTGPPEQYVEHYEELILAYVHSMDEVRNLLKRW